MEYEGIISAIYDTGNQGKPYRLLCLMAMIRYVEANNYDNYIPYSDTLMDIFNGICDEYGVARARMCNPYYHLKNSRLVDHIVKQGMEDKHRNTHSIGGTKEIYALLEGAKLDGTLYSCLKTGKRNHVVNAIDARIRGVVTGVSIETEHATENVAPVRLDRSTSGNQGDASLSDEYTNADNYVGYLNSLVNTTPGNESAIAESQFTISNFGRINIDHPISEYIANLLKAKSHVILTGNAGDGKTTIALQVATMLSNGETPGIQTEMRLPGNILLVKDFSELTDERRKEILTQVIQGDALTVLLVSNTGKLLESLTGLDTSFKSSFLNAMQAPQPTSVLKDKATLINIAQMDNLKLAMQVLKRMVNEDNWSSCRGCSEKEVCSIYRNVRLVNENCEVFIERLGLLYRRMYDYGCKLTMRQMTAHLAYGITAGLSCAQISGLKQSQKHSEMQCFSVVNRLFGDDGSELQVEAENLVAVMAMRQQGFCRWLTVSDELALSDHTNIGHLTTGALNESVRNTNEMNTESYAKRQQLRRLLYFTKPELSDESHGLFANSPGTILYQRLCTDICKADAEAKLKTYLDRVLHVLQEQFLSRSLPRELTRERQTIYITLPASMPSRAFVVLNSVPWQNYKLTVKPSYDFRDGSENDKLRYLPHLTMQIHGDAVPAELPIDLPLFDYICRRYEGVVNEPLSAFYRHRLEQFQQQHERTADDQATTLRVLSLTKGRFDVKELKFDGKTLTVSR